LQGDCDCLARRLVASDGGHGLHGVIIDGMPRPIDDLYLSPHFDDAVLSCGGTIHRRARAGRRQVVLTVCAGLPEGALTVFAEHHHRRWGASAGDGLTSALDMIARRRAEDDAALAVLGAEAVRLDVADAIYRRTNDGRAPYDDLDRLFGLIDEGERGLVDAVASKLAEVASGLGVGRRTRVWLPLAIGGHVDHRLTRAAGEAWLGRGLSGLLGRATFYEDLPYAAMASAGEIRRMAPGMRRRRERIDEVDLAAKIAAVGCYASQISTFWASDAAMAAEVRAWAVAAARGRMGSAGMVGGSGTERSGHDGSQTATSMVGSQLAEARWLAGGTNTLEVGGAR